MRSIVFDIKKDYSVIVRRIHVFVMSSLLVCTGTACVNEQDTRQSGLSFSPSSGTYNEETPEVTVHVPEGHTIAYTTDGTVPDRSGDTGKAEVTVRLESGGEGFLIAHRDRMVIPDFDQSHYYDDPSLPTGTVLSAVMLDEEGNAEERLTQVYYPGIDFAGMYPGWLVVSVVCDPEDLLDDERGILVPGAVYDAWKDTEEGQTILAERKNWLYEGNFSRRGRDWERPCMIEIYDGGRTPAVSVNAGIRVTGGTSARVNQKSFNFHFRDEYGAGFLEYELFPGIERYTGFRLVAGGNNTEYLKFKDKFLMNLVADRNLFYAKVRPAVLFLNGEYWGPYYLSERISDTMVADHFGIDRDQVVIFKEGELEEGEEEDVRLYEELMSYAERDFADPAVWEAFCGVMDADSFAEYAAFRIYIGDADWKTDANDILWRTRDTSYNDGRWQYILYDVEYSSGMYGQEITGAAYDHYHQAMELYPLFAAALRNDAFYGMFLEKIREIGSVNCAPERVNAMMQEYTDLWLPMMPDYYRRFGDTSYHWNAELKRTLEFFEDRYDLIMPVIEKRE